MNSSIVLLLSGETVINISLISYVGYELLNEPWAGDIYNEPSLLLPGIAGKENIMPLYDNLNAYIRRVSTLLLRVIRVVHLTFCICYRHVYV